MSNPTEQPLLEYAGYPEREGVVREAVEGGVRLMIPPPNWRRRLHLGGSVIFAVYATMAILVSTSRFYLVRSGNYGDFFAELGTQMLLPTLILIGLISAFRTLGSRHIVLEVNRTHILIDAPVMDWEAPGPRWRSLKFPRERVTSVKGHLHGMGLTIRVEGAELFEMMHNYPEPLLRWVAATLRDALGLAEDL